MKRATSDRDSGENEALRDRVSRLGAAVLPINASLDLGHRPARPSRGGRALTGARYGCLSTLKDSGEALDFVTAGITSNTSGWCLDARAAALRAPPRLGGYPDAGGTRG